MLKSRIGIWIFVIIICVGGTYLLEHAPTWFKTTEIGVVSEIGDANVIEEMMDKKFGEYAVKSKTDNPDIIISNSIETKDGYTLTKN